MVVTLPAIDAAVGLFESAFRPAINVLIIFGGLGVCSWRGLCAWTKNVNKSEM